MVSARPQFEAACQLHEFAGLAQWECRELVPLRRVFDSLDQLQVWPNPNGAGRVCETRFSRFDSDRSPQWAVRIRGLLTACNREMRVQFSHRPPSLARELDGRVLV
jgi:hypothetical protein